MKGNSWNAGGRRTLFRTIESDEELLHAIVHEVDLIVRHQPSMARGRISYQRQAEIPLVKHVQFHNIGLDPSLSWVTVPESQTRVGICHPDPGEKVYSSYCRA